MPTGMEVYWKAVGELYRLELGTEQTPDQDTFAEWLRETMASLLSRRVGLERSRVE